jgi:hypothetical protein
MKVQEDKVIMTVVQVIMKVAQEVQVITKVVRDSLTKKRLPLLLD